MKKQKIDWIGFAVDYTLPLTLLVIAVYKLIPLIGKTVQNASDIVSLVSNNQTVGYFILTLMSLVTLFVAADSIVFKYELLVYFYKNNLRSRIAHAIRTMLSILAVTLACLAIAIAGLDILRDFFVPPQQLSTLRPELKYALLLLGFVALRFTYGMPRRRRASLEEYENAYGTVTLTSRSMDHDERKYYLDNATPEDRLLLITLQEPREGMKDEGFYIEEEFMQHWWETIRERNINVEQVILVNSEQDVKDFEIIVRKMEDVTSFKIGYISAPPSVFYSDMYFVPGRIALLSFSDDVSARSMMTFGIKLTGKRIIERFCRMFDQVFTSEAVFVKTFEGVHEEKLEELKTLFPPESQSGD